MIEIVKNVDGSRVVTWLETNIKPKLTPDVSNYARGRQRAWLGIEPTLTSPTRHLQGVAVATEYLDRLANLIGWRFDYCLATYSGDGEEGVGITPHRDASYADYEAWGWNLCGTAEMRYWMGRECFGRGPTVKEHDPRQDPPTDVLQLQPGDVLRFNCKNLHAAYPSPRRWNLNFWRRKT